MTFAELSLAIREAVHAEGTAENLIAKHENYIRDGLIELQRRVPCLQQAHRTEFPQPTTMFRCGSTVINLRDAGVRGFLMSLWTQTIAEGCDRVDYRPVSKAEMDCVLRDQWNCGVRYQTESTVYYSPELDIAYAEASTDKPCRARCGIWTLAGDELIVFPHIQSDESVVIEWDGIKRCWHDDHEMPVHWLDECGELDRDIADALELWLEQKTARKDDEDYEEYVAAKNEFDMKAATLRWQCQKERQLPERHACFSNCCQGSGSVPILCLGAVP